MKIIFPAPNNTFYIVSRKFFVVKFCNFWQLFYEDGSVATYNGYGTLLSKTDKKGLTYTYTYDSRYRLTSITAPSGFRVTFSHNDKNLISRVTLPDGTFIKYEYDEYEQQYEFMWM